ncbi:MAG: hypothetical protein AVDCRST_MAG31-1279 [uncultured Sphingomonas sp.]|uniref:Lipoprotein n=1 Tax=uncultured Sphingomonas sp. TaxID=158754 RepID=A0A6J4T7N8_9SPHN|nr:MAG: hypothetical protein AVDCRST_MAG31-1279 [uncultured Sphingomonas sp.]
MRLPLSVGMSLALALTGCSYHYDLRAVELNGTIAFVPVKDKGTGCFSRFTVESDEGEIVWEVMAGQYLPPPCESRFPILYASPPPGMTEKVKAKPLRAGVLYKIEGWDGDSYSGAFRFRQGIVIQNVENAR